MKYFIFVWVVALLFACPVRGAEEDVVEDQVIQAPQFIETYKGGYRVELINGQKPKPDNSQGDVSPDAGEGVLTFSWCQPTGVCDPGYIFLPYAATQIDQSRINDKHNLYTITVTVNGKVQRYTWDDDAGKITFKNYQYVLQNGQAITLEHVVRKVRD